ncbi:nitronate monooxygenase [Ramlibacter sp. RBP-2]|uniref:Nitronate monooxygenase n=1 Tax=Ramlibacter lithotrophicus TaxID=2606681 RepID=A0A7X6I621_9BURK|nr:nitronate monooxygenase [Ramlibacter lithotrophicus]
MTDDPGANPCIGAVAAAELQAIAATSGLRPWQVGGRSLLPIVQGGMGVGVSAGGLAGTVAGLGGVGTISSVDLRRHHPDLMARTADVARQPDAKARVDAANLEALGREIARARKLAGGRGLLAINVMKAVMEYEHYVRHSLACGIDAVVVGAGLPLDLPELARDYPKAALIPILSDARGVQLLVRKWEKKGRLPDAIVIEHPRLAGGHLGASKIADLGDRRFDFDVVLPEATAFLRSAGLEGRVPLIPAGGISCLQDIQRLQALGAAAVQLGTAFAVTKECDAHPEFKRILAGATPQDIVEFTSVAGLPARAVRTPWLDKYLRQEAKLRDKAHEQRCNQWFDCLAHCGLRDGNAAWGQFCIDKYLGHALAGQVNLGLFFRGAGRVPFGTQIRSVQELMRWLLGGILPAGVKENEVDGWPVLEQAEALAAAEQEA